MKKIIVGSVVIGVVCAIGAAAYFLWWLPNQSQSRNSYIPIEEVLPSIPVSFLKNKTFTVPEMPEVSVILDLLSPTARRDYPMGRFTSIDGVVSGSLVALDEYTTPYENNKRAVPIAVNVGGSGEFYYLAILEGDDMRHATSVPLGDRLKIMNISRSGDQVTVNYYVHDRNQAMAEVPTVSTAAVIDISNGTVVHAGRNPANEEVLITKNFTGKYRWVATTLEDDTEVKPTDPNRFTMTFDGNRLTLETDCNTGSATFSAGVGSSTTFTVDAIAATKMFCDSKQEAEYFAMFGKAVTYQESADGKLTLELNDGGVMEFTQVKSALEFESTTNEVTSDPS